MWVQSLAQDDPTRHGAAKLTLNNCRTCAAEAARCNCRKPWALEPALRNKRSRCRGPWATTEAPPAATARESLLRAATIQSGQNKCSEKQKAHTPEMAFYPVNQSLVTWSHKVAKQVGKYSLYFGHLGSSYAQRFYHYRRRGNKSGSFCHAFRFIQRVLPWHQNQQGHRGLNICQKSFKNLPNWAKQCMQKYSCPLISPGAWF